MLIRNSKGSTAEVDERLAAGQGVGEGSVVRDAVFLNLVMATIEVQLREQRRRDEAKGNRWVAPRGRAGMAGGGDDLAIVEGGVGDEVKG